MALVATSNDLSALGAASLTRRDPHFRVPHYTDSPEEFSEKDYKADFENRFLRDIRKYGKKEFPKEVEEIRGLCLERVEYAKATEVRPGGVNVCTCTAVPVRLSVRLSSPTITMRD